MTTLLNAGQQPQNWCMSTSPATTADRFMPLNSAVGTATEAATTVLWTLPGLRALTLFIFHGTAMATDSITYTLRVNGGDTGLVVVMAALATSNSISGSIALAPGDRLTIKAVQSSTEANGTLHARAAVLVG